MTKNTMCYSRMPLTVQAGLRVCKVVGCAVRTANLLFAGLFRCARRTLRSLFVGAALAANCWFCRGLFAAKAAPTGVTISPSGETSG
jgi:hypothetical protein